METFKVRENCGLCVAHSLHDVYSFIKSLQHRGREAAGIAFIGDKSIDVIKWIGKVEMFDVEDLYKIFPSTDYHTYLAHVRYATRGRKDKILEDAHPHTIGGVIENRGNHIIIRNCDSVIVHNGQVNESSFNSINKSNLKTGCDTESLLHFFKENGERGIIKNIPGSYTLAIASRDRKEVIVLRDKFGIKPGVLGWKDGKYCISSEDCFFMDRGVIFIDDLKPGCVYYLSPEGGCRKEEVSSSEKRHCFFEYNYISNVNSCLNGTHVRNVRQFLGEELANEFNDIYADLVSFLPRCPEVAARRYAEKRNIIFQNIFYKPRSERSFLGSTIEERAFSIKDNLYLIPRINGIDTKEFLRGKTVILIDDSTIRGNNSKRAIDLLNEVGIGKIYLLNYTPKIGLIDENGVGRGCLYGVDMPPEDDFVVRNKEGRNSYEEEINSKIGANVKFLSFEGMFRAFEKAGLEKNQLCSYCIGGEKPF